MKGHGELRLDICVALVAEGRLRSLEEGLYLAVVNVVASDAAYVALGVSRGVMTPVLCLVASQALGVHFLGGSIGGVEDLGFVAALNMRMARAVATLAIDPGGAVHLRRHGMRIVGKVAGNLLVADSANVGAHQILRGRVPRLRGCRVADWIGSRWGSGQSGRGHDARA